MAPRPLLVILTVAIASIAGCSASTTGSNGSNGLGAESGSQIVAAAVSATKAQSSFHFVESAGSGRAALRIVGDVGSTSGEQHITVGNGTENGHVTVLLSNKTAYFTGDLVGLEGFTGLSAKLATPLVKKWISVPSTDSSFPSLAASLAVGTAAGQLVKLTGTLVRGASSTKLGHAAVAVKATQSSSSGTLSLTMYVATSGAALPILVEGTTKATSGSTRKVSAIFSGWGEPVHVSAPSGALPIADVKALGG